MQLLWNSVFAPSAAVDLAKQHPNTTRLGWTYVAALIVVAFVCELFARYAVRPLFGIVVEVQSDPFSWMDTVAGLTSFSIISSVLLFVGQRWFWRLFDKRAEALPLIDSAIIAGFAFSLVLLLPQYVLSEVTQNSGWVVLLVVLLPQFIVFMGYSTHYFSHALGMSLAKSFVLNVLAFVGLIVASILLYFLFFVVMSVMSGTSLDELFEIQESVQ